MPKITYKSKPELIIVVEPGLGMRVTEKGGIETVRDDDNTKKIVDSIANELNSEKAILETVFGDTEERLEKVSRFDEEDLNLHTFYRVKEIGDYTRLEILVKKLQEMKGIQSAYIKPPAELASYPPSLNDMLPSGNVPSTTGDFSNNQDYLEQGLGINARNAWAISGGMGLGVRIVDIEYGWRFSHEDIAGVGRGVIAGYALSGDSEQHGTAVIGIMGGRHNSFGIEGICPQAGIYGIATYDPVYEYTKSSWGIRKAVDILKLCGNHIGNIILIEHHRPGPAVNYQENSQQIGYIPIEWWPDDYMAIRYAILNGIIVVEAGGNGRENLDNPSYTNNRPFGLFNPFKPENVNTTNSGAIIVGAGNPPSETHNRTEQPDYHEVYVDRARCFFSNYGARVDVQGWGWEVTTTGYGDIQGSYGYPDLCYTDCFSGTSSAAPMIAGTIACVQGVLIDQRKAPLRPAEARDLIRAAITGNPQQDGKKADCTVERPASERIGNRPDLIRLINEALVLRTP